MSLEQLKILIQVSDVLVVVFSIIAAIYWFLSSKVEVPTYPHPDASPNRKNADSFRLIEQIGGALTHQSKLSSRGAVAAALAAVLTGASSGLRVFAGM